MEVFNNMTFKRKRDGELPATPAAENLDEVCSPGLTSLYEHQKIGVRWMCDNEKEGQGGINADEMGLGKTIQATEMINRGIKANPEANHDTLLVLPKSIMTQWGRELEEKGGLPSLCFYDKNRDFSAILSEHRAAQDAKHPLIVLTTYDTLRSQFFDSGDHSLLNHHWRRVILDEGHQCCNLKAKKTQAILAVRADITWILTGTPIQNRIPEFVNLLFLVTRDKTILQHNKFETRAVQYEKFEGDRKVRGEVYVKVHKTPGTNTVMSLQQLKRMYLIQRSKQQVEQRKKIRGEDISIPKLYHRDRWIDMKDEEKQEYERLYNELVLKIQRYANRQGEESAIHILSAITQLRRYCVHPLLLKQDVLSQYLGPPENGERRHLPTSSKISTIFRDILSILKGKPGDKILVFSQWTSVLDIIQHYLDYLKMPFHRLDGQTSFKDRKKGVDDFQSEEGTTRIFLVSLKAGGLGLNLTAANHVLICDLYWNEAAEKQAIARVHRDGQKKEVYVTRYVMQGEKSMESLIFDLQKRKNQHVDSICGKNGPTELPQLKLFCQQILERQKEALRHAPGHAEGREAKRVKVK